MNENKTCVRGKELPQLRGSLSVPSNGKHISKLTALTAPPRVSVIIPTLNESLTIEKVLTNIPAGVVDEVIVVDSSVDDTPDIARRLMVKVIYENRPGYGRALQTGIENTSGDIVVYIDGDCTYDPKEIPKLIQPILSDKYDVVLGSRLGGKLLPGSMSSLKKIGNLMLSLFFNILFRKKVRDTQSGFRAIRIRLLRRLSYENYGMPYVTEQLIKLVKKEARIAEIPITYGPRKGETKLCAGIDGLKILKVIFKGRFLGEY